MGGCPELIEAQRPFQLVPSMGRKTTTTTDRRRKQTSGEDATDYFTPQAIPAAGHL